MPEKAQAEHTSTGASAGNNDPYGIVEKILGYHKTINPDKYVFSPLWNPETGEYYEPDRKDRIVIWDRYEPFPIGFDLSHNPIQPHDFLLTSHFSNEDNLLQCSAHFLYFDVYFNNIDRVDNTKFDKLADILLGNPKPIRKKILAKLEDYDLLESSLVNLFYVYRSPDMPICELESSIMTTKDSMVDYNGNWISQTLPTEIYTRTALSFIAESDPHLKHYMTEKTFKPLLAGRPFLGLQCRGALQELKKLGFETFDRWWDESYDDIKDQKERAYACVDILNQLSKNNLSLMLQDMEGVLEHNHNVAKQGIEVFYNKDAIHFINNLT